MSINYNEKYEILCVVKTFEEVIEQGVNGNDVKGKRI